MAARTAKILVCLAAFALTGVVNASAAPAPTNLHPFALRADESRDRVFSRTPAFAWNPVRGALRYEFQLSTGSSFRENGIVYADSSLTTPVASPSLTLPWISGSPHALYARVRAVLAGSTTNWSAPYGFDMQAASIAAPLPSQPGLLRWTPVDGAVAYQVWFVDIPKVITTPTNVADEREFYAFHQSASWLSNVRWRVRAIRNILNNRANGLPATSFGAWSPVYSSVNPPFSTGQLRPLMTVSDVVANGTASAPAHKLTPAFVFGGNASGGFTTELYRVHVYTDKQCVNRVYSSTIVGSPAYAPRESGPLQLPTSAESILAARSRYLGDGDEGTSYAADNFEVKANESLADVKPTSGLPKGTVEGEPSGSSTPPAPTTPAPAPAPGAPTTPAPTSTDPAVVELVQWTSDAGPPVGLWDTDWDRGGGYYWTVVPVEAYIPGAASTTLSGAGGAVGGTVLPVASSSGFAVGDAIMVGSSGIAETATITAVSAGTITITPALKLSHQAGETVVRMSGSVVYRDTELGQDACAAGRVLRFGKESEPVLTAGGEAFISGLSPTGKLSSATENPAFYGTPLVAWTAALGADVYAVQWSKTRSPFKPETDPASTALGMMTLNTNALLPLEPGTWYYRVRGYSFSLPLEAQAMSWSTPQKIVVARPTFTVVHDSEQSGATRTLTSRSAGLSIRLPSSFRQGARSTASLGGFRQLSRSGSSLRVTAREGSRAALFIQTVPDRGAAWATRARASARSLGAKSCSQVSLAAGAAVRCSGTKGAQASVVYMLQHRGVTYTLTFAGKPSRRGADAARFAAAARSLRFTR